MVLHAAAVLVASLTAGAVAGSPVALEYPRAEPVSAAVSGPSAAPADLVSAPLASQPLSSAPLPSGPLSSAPFSSAPLSSAPLASGLNSPAARVITVPALRDRLTTSRGTALLRGLATLPAHETAALLAETPALVERTLASPPAPRQVDRWWSSLSAAEQLSMTSAAPQLVGNLDGVPYAMRDLANRTHLRAVVDTLELTDPSTLGASERHVQSEQLQLLYSVLDALGPATANPARQLISLDADGQGKAAIVVGDLATADYVSYLVPGMFISVRESMVEWVDTAARLHDEQVSWLTLLSEAGAQGATSADDASAASVPEVATVAWIGYQTPHLLNVGSLDLAYEGRDALASAVQGLTTLRGDDRPFLSLLAHSYGSTAAMLALTDTPATVDALAMIGSPGAPGASMASLNVRGEVFVGEAAWDPIPNSSFFGPDPGSTEFGARAMSVAGGVDVITNRVLEGSTGHNAYFSPGTESMRNMALIAIDRGELVTDGTTTDALRTLDAVL